MFKKLARKEEGFTLIELLVVVAIIALLTAFAVPRLFEAINTSKGAQGNSDMQTVSGAMERHYMDNSKYPTGTTGTSIGDALKGNYLKAGTTLKNGFGKGYIYISDDDGGYYILVDPKNQPVGQSLTITCGSGTTPPTATATVDDEFTVVQSSTISPADVKAACTVSAGNTGYQAPIVITN